MKIKTSTQFGNFTVEIAGEFTDEQVKVLAAEGLAKATIGENGSKLDKKLGGFDGPKDKRPDKWSRGSVAYSEANADVVAAGLSSVTLENEVVRLEVSAVEYIASTELTLAKKTIANKNGSMSALQALADKVGFDATDDELSSDNVEFQRAVANYIRGI